MPFLAPRLVADAPIAPLDGRGIGADYQSQGGNGHLAIQGPLDAPVDDALQGDRRQRRSPVEGVHGDRVLHVAEGRECRPQVGVVRQRNGYGALNIHVASLPSMPHLRAARRQSDLWIKIGAKAGYPRAGDAEAFLPGLKHLGSRP